MSKLAHGGDQSRFLGLAPSDEFQVVRTDGWVVSDGGKGGHVQGPANPPVALLADTRESVDGGTGLAQDDVQAGIAGQLLRPDLAESGSVFADEGQSGLFSDARNREQQTRALGQLGVLVEVHSGLGPAKLEGPCPGAGGVVARSAARTSGCRDRQQLFPFDRAPGPFAE